MPKFFFNVYDDIVACDEDGLDLPGLDAARETALAGARALACDQVRDGRLNLSHRIDIADEDGRVVETVAFADAVRIEP